MACGYNNCIKSLNGNIGMNMMMSRRISSATDLPLLSMKFQHSFYRQCNSHASLKPSTLLYWAILLNFPRMYYIQ